MPLDDDIDMTIEAFNFQGGQYKKMLDKRFDKFCKSLYVEVIKGPYAKFYDSSTIKLPFGTCPYPEGKNEITNLIFDDEGMLPPYIPGGEKWRVDLRFVNKEEVFGGYNVYAMIRNEQSLLKGG